MALELEGYLSEPEHLEGELSEMGHLEGDLSIPMVVGGQLTEEFKQALLQMAEKVAYIDDHGQDYYDDLYNALYPPVHATAITLDYDSLSFYTPNNTQQLTATLIPSNATDRVVWESSNTEVATVSNSGLVTVLDYGSAIITATAGSVSATCSVLVAQATLTSISAVYTQSGTVYDTDSLDSLKSDLVVTALYEDSSTAIVPATDYTLNGTLTAGTSTITVTYGGKTTTFNVTVTAVPVLSSITAVYTQSGTVYDTDSLDSLKADLVVTAVYTDSSTEVVPSTDYTLSGTLTAGTSTITVTYEEKTTSFNVTVTRLEIKVYKGKGTSGTSIVDNANRALSEMFPLSFASPVHVRFPDRANNTYTFAFKFCNGANAVTSLGASAVPQSYLGTTQTAGIYTTWLATDEELWLATKPTTWNAVTNSTSGIGDGNVRLAFKNVTNDTSPITATIDGIVYINDVPYHLVESDVSDYE